MHTNLSLIVFLFPPQKTGSLSTEDQPPTLKIFGKRRYPYTPSQTRFLNGLAYNRSKVLMAFAQSDFFHTNFHRCHSQTHLLFFNSYFYALGSILRFPDDSPQLRLWDYPVGGSTNHLEGLNGLDSSTALGRPFPVRYLPRSISC